MQRAQTGKKMKRMHKNANNPEMTKNAKMQKSNERKDSEKLQH